MKSYKAIVTGPFNAGKTSFVRAASDIEIVTTERRITDPGMANVKEETTVAMDYGQRRVGDVMLHLYGTPGQARFEFMWDILSREMDLFILIVDSNDRGSFMDAVQILRLFRKQANVPYFVVANKQDGESVMSVADIAKLLKLPESVSVITCVAHEPDSVTSALEKIVAQL
ncbi:MAG: ATP/GTP-binding protein [Anaerolineae bacterium]|nr:ATP/GTP-binding protein [Anaerolineae bacterium]